MWELITGEAHNPHGTLGAHADGKDTVVRALRRGAGQVSVVVADSAGSTTAHPMRRVIEEGLFEVTIPGEVDDYRLDVDGHLVDDPYHFLPTITEFDLQLITEGRHEQLWTVLGARPLTHDGVAGVACSVRGHNPESYVREVESLEGLPDGHRTLADHLRELTSLEYVLPAVKGDVDEVEWTRHMDRHREQAAEYQRLADEAPE